VALSVTADSMTIARVILNHETDFFVIVGIQRDHLSRFRASGKPGAVQRTETGGF
jgi:hypothetical protein